jgi:hypothetical protein
VTHEEFHQWVEGHVKATADDTNAVRLTDLLWANRHIIVDQWQATYAEICECTDQMVEAGRVPKFPNQHTNALDQELKLLRAERKARLKTYGKGNYQFGHPAGCVCPQCHNGTILPEFEQQKAQTESALTQLQRYIIANGGTLLRDQRE